MQIYDKGDAMPAEYKQALIHLLSFQADSEYAGAQRAGENMQFAPRPEEAYRLAKKVMEEYGHAFYLWTILEELGVEIEPRIAELRDNPENPDPKKVNIINGFRPTYWRSLFTSWDDVALFSCVTTPAGVIFLDQYTKCSYKPWARVSERIGREEVGHMGFGLWAVKRIIEFEGDTARERLQARLPKFIRMGLGTWGRPSKPGTVQSQNFERYHAMGLKPLRPEECNEAYVEMVSKRLEGLGMYYPDDVEPDYDQRVGYVMDDAELARKLAGTL